MSDAEKRNVAHFGISIRRVEFVKISHRNEAQLRRQKDHSRHHIQMFDIIFRTEQKVSASLDCNQMDNCEWKGKKEKLSENVSMNFRFLKMPQPPLFERTKT